MPGRCSRQRLARDPDDSRRVHHGMRVDAIALEWSVQIDPEFLRNAVKALHVQQAFLPRNGTDFEYSSSPIMLSA